MEKNSTTDAAPLFSGEAWFDPIEAELRERIRGFLEEMVEQEATAALGRSRYQRGAAAGYRNGTRSRRLLGSFGPVEIAVPRARLLAADGTSREWRSAVLPRYARMTRQVEALIASAYLAGTNTRRVKRALGALFKGAIGKDVVSRVWRKVKTDLYEVLMSKSESQCGTPSYVDFLVVAAYPQVAPNWQVRRREAYGSSRATRRTNRGEPASERVMRAANLYSVL